MHALSGQSPILAEQIRSEPPISKSGCRSAVGLRSCGVRRPCFAGTQRPQDAPILALKSNPWPVLRSNASAVSKNRQPRRSSLVSCHSGKLPIRGCNRNVCPFRPRSIPAQFGSIAGGCKIAPTLYPPVMVPPLSAVEGFPKPRAGLFIERYDTAANCNTGSVGSRPESPLTLEETPMSNSVRRHPEIQ